MFALLERAGLNRSRFLSMAAVFASFALSPQNAVAQTATPARPASVAAPMVLLPQIEGKTIDGAPFKLSSLKGKVVLVMY